MVEAATTTWTDEQRAIIEASPSARLIVEAGPGTGKTAVACGRVAALIDAHQLMPSKILLVSFTRTAVAELRNRIVTYAKDKEQASAVRISTIDSHAWRFRNGFEDPETKAFGGQLTYESNLERMLQVLKAREPEPVAFLEKLQHVLVDEAQDVVGLRARLLSELLGLLGSECGVTVFGDPAQAIYGFTTDRDAKAKTDDAASLSELLGSHRKRFEPRKLTRIFRTSDPTVLALFKESRAKLMGSGKPSQRYPSVRDAIKQNATDLAKPQIDDLAGRSDALVLFRRCAEVLTASYFLSRDGIPHRLRMSGLPTIAHPWIAAVLSEHTQPTVTRAAFDMHWAKQAVGPIFTGLVPEECWNVLWRAAGRHKHVDMLVLREMLARPRPPIELCQGEVGISGPILGTIHASKGREAPYVRLMLPHPGPGDDSEDTEWDEESRVLYVAATRARERVELGKGNHSYPTPLRSRRSFRIGKRVWSFQLGLENDVDVSAHAAWPEADAIQGRLRALATECVEGRAVSTGDPKQPYRLHEAADANKRYLGQLTEDVTRDLVEVSRITKHELTKELRFFFFGARTVAVRHGESDHLRMPYRQSGIFLAPVVKS